MHFLLQKNEVSSLKKLIQEKEEALRSEQKLYQSATEQINDLIQELNEKKAQASATEKSLRDALNQEQQEIKALHGMMQRKREQYASELNAMQSKMQQVNSFSYMYVCVCVDIFLAGKKFEWINFLCVYFFYFSRYLTNALLI